MAANSKRCGAIPGPKEAVGLIVIAVVIFLSEYVVLRLYTDYDSVVFCWQEPTPEVCTHDGVVHPKPQRGDI